MKKKHYFTLGQAHIHHINGVTIDHDGVIEIEADDAGAARERMFAIFGRKWSMQYDEKSISMSHYPRGVVLRLTA